MKKISIVIGANYGDEGKGSTVNALADSNTLVIRCNGGPQMGHTVVHNNIRHVFSNFSSGTLKGAKTYIAGTAIVNPMTFKKEYNTLKEKGFLPKIFISENCIVTTPFDMLINQATELALKENAYGSCGLGIWETIQRNKIEKYSFRIKDINPSHGGLVYLKNILENIKNNYFQNRLAESLNWKDVPIPISKVRYYDLITPFIKDVEFFFSNINIISNEKEESFVKSYNNIIFENSQGLLLSQEREKDGEHVTPSYTGLKIPKEFIKKYNLEEDYSVDVYYCTRWYLTRHGNGPLKNEKRKEKIGDNITDFTNIKNDFQGELRFARLDIDELIERIRKDSYNSNYNINFSISCMGQYKQLKSKKIQNEILKRYDIIDKNRVRFLSYYKFLNLLFEKTKSNIKNFNMIYRNDLNNFYKLFKSV